MWYNSSQMNKFDDDDFNRVNASICTRNTIIATDGSVIFGAVWCLRALDGQIEIVLKYPA